MGHDLHRTSPEHTTIPGIEERATALPLALAAAGAGVGALLWAGVAWATGLEIGYVAWILGGLVGGGCVLGGGHGRSMAIAAAALTLVGIAGGRLYGTHLLVGSQLEALAAMFDRSQFERLRQDARAFAQLPAAPSVEQVRTFMSEHEYAEGVEPAEITDEDVSLFLDYQRQSLAMLADPSCKFEQWRDAQIAEVQRQLSVPQLVVDGISPIDLLFALLGVSTAFGMVAKRAPAAQPA